MFWIISVCTHKSIVERIDIMENYETLQQANNYLLEVLDRVLNFGDVIDTRYVKNERLEVIRKAPNGRKDLQTLKICKYQ